MHWPRVIGGQVSEATIPIIRLSRPPGPEGLAFLGRGFLFVRAFLVALRHPAVWLGATVHEAARQARDSLPLVLLLSTLGGGLIAQQTGYQFQGNLPSWVIGSIVSSSLITEVTPLFVGLGIKIGRASCRERV